MGCGHALFLTMVLEQYQLWSRDSALAGWMDEFMDNAWQASAQGWDEALANSPLEEFRARVVRRPCWLPSLGAGCGLVPWLEPPSSLTGLPE